MDKIASTCHPFRTILGLLTLFACTACGTDRFEIRSNPVHDACVQSLLTVHVETGENGPVPSSPLSLDAFQALTQKESNLKRAIGFRKYVLHFYRRMPEMDEEVTPVKFPLFWNIDSTRVQTEGTYLLEFLEGDKVKIDFRCTECKQIDTNGQSLPSKKSGFETSFTTSVTATQATEDWHFSHRPRTVKLKEEIGKTWIVRLESQQTYLEAAKTRIQVSTTEYANTFSLQFSDPLSYRATNFVKELGIAVALDDQAIRVGQIEPRLEVLNHRIDSVKEILGATESDLNANSSMNAPGKDQPKPDQWKKLEAGQAVLVSLLREQSTLLIEKFSVLPRILVISPGNPCKK